MEYVIQGLSIGGAYALIAVGYTMVYGIIQLINFAHGEIFMFGAFCTFALIGETDPARSTQMAAFVWFVFVAVGNFALGPRVRKPQVRWPAVLLTATGLAYVYFLLCNRQISFYLALPLSMVITACLGIAVDRVAYKPLRHAPRLAPLITAIGTSLFLANLMMVIWGARTRSYPQDAVPAILKVPLRVDASLFSPERFADLAWTDGAFFTSEMLTAMTWTERLLVRHEIGLGGDRVVSVLSASIFLISVALMILLNIVVHKTKLGRAMRACAEDKQVAALMGVNVDRTIAATFAIGSSLAAVGGALYALNYRTLKPDMGLWAGVVAFAAAVLGGIGNLTGAMVGGFMIGIAISVATPLGISNWANGVAFAIMIMVIVFRPQGIFGKASAKRA